MLNEIKKTAAWIKEATADFTPEVGIILGTGLGDFGDIYRMVKSNLQAKEESLEFVAVAMPLQDQLVYVTCTKNANTLNVKYTLAQGNIDIWQNEKYVVYDAQNQYYDMNIDERIVKVPALENVVSLNRDVERDFVANNYMNLRYEYENNTTGEQKDSYLSNYGKFLLENGFSQGKNEKEFLNGIVKISIMNDYSFSITITKDFN